jgi:hypothetical protein
MNVCVPERVLAGVEPSGEVVATGHFAASYVSLLNCVSCHLSPLSDSIKPARGRVWMKLTDAALPRTIFPQERDESHDIRTKADSYLRRALEP